MTSARAYNQHYEPNLRVGDAYGAKKKKGIHDKNDPKTKLTKKGTRGKKKKKIEIAQKKRKIYNQYLVDIYQNLTATL